MRCCALILLASSAVGFTAERTAAPRRAQTARRAVRELRSIDDFESALASAGDDVLITFANVEILILDERKGRLDEDDFIF